MGYTTRDGKRVIDHDEEDEIRSLLVGRSVQKVADDRLVLDDGTVLEIVANVGGCSCGAGDYELTELNEVGNVITNVEFECEDRGYGSPPDYDQQPTVYRLFVYAEDRRLPLATFEGDDGNGYYGTGYSIHVLPAT